MMDGEKIFNQPAKKKLRTYNSIRKNTTGQWDDTKVLFCYIIINSETIITW